VVPAKKISSWVFDLGRYAMEQWKEFGDYLRFVGELTMEGLRVSKYPKKFRWAALASVIDKTGLRALPIIALLSFMIGVVMAYQMGTQLRNYGANLFIVDFLGLSILREFGPLLTAIMVAGRTGSAFTAQLGTMNINQEIDALNTMGVTPAELLLLPRIVGLLITLPLLVMWADIFGIIGGMLTAHSMLGVTPHDFLLRFNRVIPLRTLFIGLGKAPVFALLIASIGCFEGLRVHGSSDSVGLQTTRSVVLSIFFIIVADAVFSILFSKMQL
jgi:phospholipid/cholesterol/gamma-HCH transport system permease protein